MVFQTVLVGSVASRRARSAKWGYVLESVRRIRDGLDRCLTRNAVRASFPSFRGSLGTLRCELGALSATTEVAVGPFLTAFSQQLRNTCVHARTSARLPRASS